MSKEVLELSREQFFSRMENATPTSALEFKKTLRKILKSKSKQEILEEMTEVEILTGFGNSRLLVSPWQLFLFNATHSMDEKKNVVLRKSWKKIRDIKDRWIRESDETTFRLFAYMTYLYIFGTGEKLLVFGNFYFYHEQDK